jgi:TonB family protein
MKTFLRISAILVMAALITLFNIGIIDVRLNEMSYLLGTIAAREDASKTLGIVAKYELIKQRMLNGEDNISSYELEAKIQALTSGDTFEKQQTKGWRDMVLVPVRSVTNAIRLMMGKQIISPNEDNNTFKVIEIGYFWERNRKYRDAIKIYDELGVKSDIDSDIRAAVLVHKAFCHSMLSEYDVAKGLYEQVISEYPQTESGMLSWKLLDFIQSLESQRQRVQLDNSSSLEKAKQFYMLMDYRNAIKHLSLHLGQHSQIASATTFEARYYKGRSHEELGETQEAMNEYNYIINNETDKTWGKQANRRMLMLGEFYESRQNIAAEARKRLEQYQDGIFVDKVKQYTAMVSASSLRDELLASTQDASAGVSSESSDSMLNFINKIGDFDLSGEQQERRQQEQERLRRELIESGAMSTTQVKELERRSALAQNPYRRPSAIKQVVDKHASELQYIYNKVLRRGDKLSGKMVVSIQISPGGAVGAASVVQSDIGDEVFEQEIVQRIKQWQFAEVPDTLGNLTVNYPFEFYKEE